MYRNDLRTGCGGVLKLAIVFSLTLSLFAAAASADNGHNGFDATLKNCTELIGLGPVPFATARALVPASYVLIPFNGSAGLVIRAAHCEGVGFDKGAAQPAIVAQVGIAVVSPDGSGDINNYTLLYSTDNDQLAKELSQAGQPAVLDKQLCYEFSPDASGNGEIYAAVSPAVQPAWFLTGSAGPPAPSGTPTVANWWFDGSRGVVKVATSIPSISYGTANFSLHTSKSSLLGSLIGGNTYGAFVFFNARGVFSVAGLAVTVK
jgi:hypothetical protein